jgi:2-amino-4-hydroxy-6-hydroxymethyldihydropteridine diphosphokinase
MPLSYLGLGSNIGDPQANVEEAIRRLENVGKVLKKSKFYVTAPWGVLDQPDFVNAVIQIDTEYTPRTLLEKIQAIEQDMGRVATFKWGPRLIDIDILTYADVTVQEPDLTIPHPFMTERSFVMIPLAEIDESFRIEDL